MEPTRWPGVWRAGRDLFTESLVPGQSVYGEERRTEGGKEYRRIDPWRSKLAAWLARGEPPPLFSGAERVLYLGAAHGTTVSHLSDMLPEAELYVVEKSPVAFAPLLALARSRPNLFPILADAQLPERYAADVGEADVLYQDVAQRNQVAIFLENASAVLAPGGRGVLMLKVRSITQRRSAGAVLAESRQALVAGGFAVRSATDLSPFAREHSALFVEPRRG